MSPFFIRTKSVTVRGFNETRAGARNAARYVASYRRERLSRYGATMPGNAADPEFGLH
jgi:hypothetical protein